MEDDITTSAEAEAAQGRLRAAIEAEKLFDELFDVADALVRSQIKKGQLAPPEDHNALVVKLVSDALVVVHKKAHEYDPNRRVLPWLIGIVKKKLLSHSRDLGRNREDLILDTKLADRVAAKAEVKPTEDDLFSLLECEDEERQIEARLVWERLRPKLCEQDVDLLERWYVKDQPVEEIAEAYGISTDYVYTLLSRARNAARKLQP